MTRLLMFSVLFLMILLKLVAVKTTEITDEIDNDIIADNDLESNVVEIHDDTIESSLKNRTQRGENDIEAGRGEECVCPRTTWPIGFELENNSEITTYIHMYIRQLFQLIKLYPGAFPGDLGDQLQNISKILGGNFNETGTSLGSLSESVQGILFDRWPRELASYSTDGVSSSDTPGSTVTTISPNMVGSTSTSLMVNISESGETNILEEVEFRHHELTDENNEVGSMSKRDLSVPLVEEREFVPTKATTAKITEITEKITSPESSTTVPISAPMTPGMKVTAEDENGGKSNSFLSNLMTFFRARRSVEDMDTQSDELAPSQALGEEIAPSHALGTQEAHIDIDISEESTPTPLVASIPPDPHVAQADSEQSGDWEVVIGEKPNHLQQAIRDVRDHQATDVTSSTSSGTELVSLAVSSSDVDLLSPVVLIEESDEMKNIISAGQREKRNKSFDSPNQIPVLLRGEEAEIGVEYLPHPTDIPTELEGEFEGSGGDEEGPDVETHSRVHARIDRSDRVGLTGAVAGLPGAVAGLPGAVAGLPGAIEGLPGSGPEHSSDIAAKVGDAVIHAAGDMLQGVGDHVLHSGVGDMLHSGVGDMLHSGVGDMLHSGVGSDMLHVAEIDEASGGDIEERVVIDRVAHSAPIHNDIHTIPQGVGGVPVGLGEGSGADEYTVPATTPAVPAPSPTLMKKREVGVELERQVQESTPNPPGQKSTPNPPRPHKPQPPLVTPESPRQDEVADDSGSGGEEFNSEFENIPLHDVEFILEEQDAPKIPDENKTEVIDSSGMFDILALMLKVERDIGLDEDTTQVPYILLGVGLLVGVVVITTVAIVAVRSRNRRKQHTEMRNEKRIEVYQLTPDLHESV